MPTPSESHGTVNSNRTGVILAAGFGSRLKGTVDDVQLKPLTPVAGTPLIYRVINSLQTAGCRRIVIVLGHGHNKVRQEILSEYTGEALLEFVYNQQYELSNGVSLLAAAEKIEGEFVLTMSDHIISDSIMKLVQQHTPPKEGATLMVDFKIEAIFDLEDATKVLADKGSLVSIGKQIETYNCIDTGVFLCTEGLLKQIQAVYDERGDASLSDGVQRLAEKGKMQVMDIGDGFWQDVDTPEMHRYAEQVLSER